MPVIKPLVDALKILSYWKKSIRIHFKASIKCGTYIRDGSLKGYYFLVCVFKL